ncbi:MAG TPA: SPOR domain-containing protein [Candidatus Omnitrophota bacterium]|mgnify:CR=1 FL=1|nr:SPOR domain-containing protein [Candidatus Omnitrophota bacterium]HPN88384.1 SPOR domain-containing protein [Candidatus Omnitrophota bacterium]
MDIRQKIHLLLLVFIIFGFCGFSPDNLADLETAILKADYKLGEDIALRFLKENPEKEFLDAIEYYLGICYLKQAKYEDAREMFQKVITSSHADNDIRDRSFLGLYDSYYMQENYDQALKVIQEGLQKSLKSNFLSLFYFKYARVSLKLAHWAEAQKYFEKIIKEFPQSFEADLAKELLNEKRYFSVQVGSFKDQLKAQDTMNDLKKKGYYAYLLETADKQKNKFYRVRVGQFSKLDEARKLKSELSQQGYPTQIYP